MNTELQYSREQTGVKIDHYGCKDFKSNPAEIC